MQPPKLDPRKLTSAQRDQLEVHEHGKKMLQSLTDIADMTQEMITGFDKMDENSRKDTSAMGALLVDMRDSLTNIKEKDSPEAPDYASPVVTAVSKLERAFSEAIKAIDVKPQVTVSAPNVKVDAPNIDLKGIEKLLKEDMPKAFQEAIALIPVTEIPQQTDRWDEVLEWLESIDTASRLKPEAPSTVKVVNPDGSTISSGGSVEVFSVNDIDDAAATEYYGFTKPSATYMVKKITSTGVSYATILNNSGTADYSTAWSNRVSLTYGRFDEAF